MIRNGLFTSEAVSAGHPDKLCDRISDAILDAFLARDSNSRVACECFAADGKILVAGEFRARDNVVAEVTADAKRIVRQTIRDVGYGCQDTDVDPDRCEVEVRFNSQSIEIGKGVDGGTQLGAGDQGLMFGYAVDETEELMPLAWSLANDLIACGSELRSAGGTFLRPDAKSQVTLRYDNFEVVGVQAVVLSWQHDGAVGLDDVRRFLSEEIVAKVIPPEKRTTDFKIHLNPSGKFTTGGPKGDTGLTGRKIIVDTYGGSAPHGGGAFSGKDPSKVDRSGAYAARHVAKNIVGAGLANRCTVQLAYAIGVADPVSVNVDTHGTGKTADNALSAAAQHLWDLTPAGIIRELDLLRPIYRETAVLGHFGRWRSPEKYLWERLDRVPDLISMPLF